MKFINGLKSLTGIQQACVATIGNFDGLHIGHQTILAHLEKQAKELNLPLTVISFEPLPAEYFMLQPPARIYPLRDKIQRLSQLGVTSFLCLKFNFSLASSPPKVFIEDVLINKMNVKYLTVGDDFRFGYKREGGFNLLKEVGEAHGMSVKDTSTQILDGERISSTRIREALMIADLNSANKLLGHQYQLNGRIRHGEKRGRTIGFPTINMKMTQNIALKFGVYAVKVHGLNDKPINGVANLGTRPTVGGEENRLETHLFNFDEDVYGKYITVEFVEFIRAEHKFENFDALKAQIKMDADKARELLLLSK